MFVSGTASPFYAPLPLEVGPFNSAKGSGEHCKLPQRRKPILFLSIFASQKLQPATQQLAIHFNKRAVNFYLDFSLICRPTWGNATVSPFSLVF